MAREIKPKETVILLERAKELLKECPDASAGARSRALMALRLATKFQDATYFSAGKTIAELETKTSAEEYLQAAIGVEQSKPR